MPLLSIFLLLFMGGLPIWTYSDHLKGKYQDHCPAENAYLERFVLKHTGAKLADECYLERTRDEWIIAFYEKDLADTRNSLDYCKKLLRETTFKLEASQHRR